MQPGSVSKCTRSRLFADEIDIMGSEKLFNFPEQSLK